MARTRWVLLVLPLAIVVSLPALALDQDVKEAIQAYSARDYAQAVFRLKQADQKDALVRYYLALSYQGLGDYRDAESQYMWGYKHDRNKDLRYKSWLGLEGLSMMHKSPKLLIAGLRHTNDSPAGFDPGPRDKDGKPIYKGDVHQGKPYESYATFTPGCSRHW